MFHLMNLVAELKRRFEASGTDETGQGLVEYSLILVLVSIAAIAIMILLGAEIVNVFTTIVNTLETY